MMLLVAVLGVALGAAPPKVQAQTGRSDDARLARLRAWRAAVDAHEAGRRDRALVDVVTWSEGDLTAVVSDVGELSRVLLRAHARLRQSGRPPTVNFGRKALSMAEVQELLGLTEEEARLGDTSRLALRGALLHTDVATLIEDRDRAWLSTVSSSRRASVIVRDGQHLGETEKGLHWEIGRDLLDLLGGDPRAREVVRRWYVATSAFMQSRLLLSDLRQHLEQALQRFPDDPHLLFYLGSMHETFASPESQTVIPDVRLAPGEKVDVGSVRLHLRQARQAFERALASNPQLVEARLRLGRTLSVMGRHDEAVDQLRRVPGGPVSRIVEYYAALLLGEAEAALGRTDSSWQAFARAAALYPSAQSPRLAMSRLAHVAGRETEALAGLMQVLEKDPDDPGRFDPWWIYFWGRIDEADRLVGEWRACVGTWE